MARILFYGTVAWLFWMLPGQAADERPQRRVVTREIESSVDHNHCTTRQFQHMSFKHGGAWFVFYSDGKDYVYQTSSDEGQTWQRGRRLCVGLRRFDKS